MSEYDDTRRCAKCGTITGEHQPCPTCSSQPSEPSAALSASAWIIGPLGGGALGTLIYPGIGSIAGLLLGIWIAVAATTPR